MTTFGIDELWHVGPDDTVLAHDTRSDPEDIYTPIGSWIGGAETPELAAHIVEVHNAWLHSQQGSA